MNAIKPFAGSALIERTFAKIPAWEARKWVARLLTWGQLYNAELVEHVSEDQYYFDFRSLMLFLTTVSEAPPSDHQMKSMRRYLVARKIYELAPDQFLEVRTRPEALATTMEAGAIGLYEVGNRQFRKLRENQDLIAAWLASQGASRVWIIDSPRGGTVPAQVLHAQLLQRGIATSIRQLLAPRRETGGQYSIREAISQLQLGEAPDHVVYVDDANTGTRFIKMFDELKRAFGNKLVSSVQLSRRSSQSPAWTENRAKLESRLSRELSLGALFPTFQIYPELQPQHVDSGPRIQVSDYEELPWIADDVVIGARKVAFTFDMVARYGEMARLLATGDQSTLRLLRSLWGKAVDGNEYIHPPRVLEKIMADIFGQFDLKALMDLASKTFPEELRGRLPAISASSLTSHLRWIGSAILDQLSKHHSIEKARMGFHALELLMQQRVGHLPDPISREYRDHQFAPAMIPYCSALAAFNKQLVKTIVTGRL